MEEAEAPFRCRLQKDRLKFSRDIAKWEPRAPVKRMAKNNRRKGGGPNPGQELRGDERLSSDSDAGGGDGEGGDGAGFFAFPLVVHNSHAHHVVRR